MRSLRPVTRFSNGQAEVLIAVRGRAPIILLVLLAFAGSILLAQNTDTLTTGTLDNGRFWAQMDSSGKLNWVHGYLDGLKVGAETIGAVPDKDFVVQADRLTPSQLLFSEIIAGVDHFYSDTPENGPIPISNALHVVSAKARGIDPSEIEKKHNRISARGCR